MLNALGRTGEAADPLRDCFLVQNAPTTSVEAARNALAANDWRGKPYSGWRWRGYPFHEGTMWRNWYNHLMPPNTPCWRQGSGSWWDLVSPASSAHTGIVNVALCDGSVQTIADDIDANAWTEMGTRAGWPQPPTP